MISPSPTPRPHSYASHMQHLQHIIMNSNSLKEELVLAKFMTENKCHPRRGQGPLAGGGGEEGQD